MKTPNEVFIYLQKIKLYFENNETVRNYFLSNVDENIFFTRLSEISEENYKKNGDATVTEVQFESLKKELRSKLKITSPIINMGELGEIFLN